MKSVYGLYGTGLFSKCMDLDRKKYIYSTYCRPVFTYGMDIINVIKKNVKHFRTDEAILMKRILCVNKKSKTTLIYQTLEIREPIYQIY
jgi:hypothetical protein